MKYKIEVPLDDKVVRTELKCRWDAKFKTLAEKIVSTIDPLLADEINVIKYQYIKGSIWTNGGYNEMWIHTDNNVIPVIVTREDGMGVFI